MLNWSVLVLSNSSGDGASSDEMRRGGRDRAGGRDCGSGGFSVVPLGPYLSNIL